MKNMNEIHTYLKSHHWSGSLPNYAECQRWNYFSSDEEAEEDFRNNRERLFRVVQAEFQARHSAFSDSGAKAYADNWN